MAATNVTEIADLDGVSSAAGALVLTATSLDPQPVP
jgi:hypothetical protein